MTSSNKKYSKPSLYRQLRGHRGSQDGEYTTQFNFNPWDDHKKLPSFEAEKFYASQSEAGSFRRGSQNSLALSHGYPNPSKTRRGWELISRVFTLLIPDLILTWLGGKDAASRQSLREKITLFLLMLGVSSLFVVWVEIVPYSYCTPKQLYSPEELSGSKYVAINGKIADLSHSTSTVGEEVRRYLGKDVSPMFPSFTLLARTRGATEYPDHEINRCIHNLTKADNWLEKRIFNDPGYRVSNQKLIECPGPADRPMVQPTRASTHCFYNISVRFEVAKATIGDLVFDYSILGSSDTPQLGHMIVNDHLYDVSDLIKYSEADPDARLFPRDVTDLIVQHVGQDATEPFSKLEHSDIYLRCMDKLFYKGTVKEVVYPRCNSFNPILWLTLGLPFMILTTYTVVALLEFPHKGKLMPSSNCIVMVPCYGEDQLTLKLNFDSVARTNLDDSNKLLMVICDGVFTPPGSTVYTHQLVLDVLGFSGPEPELKAYISLGEGNKNVNLAKVYSGFYSCGTHRIAYVVVVKCGNPMEIRYAGNRGKRDSVLIMWNLLEGLLDPHNKLTPLEYELYHHINNVIGMDPRSFQYALVLDADTYVTPGALSKLIDRMDQNQQLMALSGHVKPANPSDSFITMLQVYPFFMTHHFKPAFESMVGGVNFLHGPCTMYRIKFADNKPCVVDTSAIVGFSTPRPNTMHLQNTLLLGEDSFFSVILLKTFPQLRLGFESSAIFYTKLTPIFSVFLGQQGRATSAAFHSHFELARVHRGLIHQVVTGVKLLSHMVMPVFLLYLYYVVIRSVATDELSYLVVGATLLCMLGFNVMILAVRGMFSSVFWLVFALLFSLPFYCFIIPLYSLWHRDDRRWVDTIPTGAKSIRRKHGILDDTSSQYKVSMQISLLTIAEYDELENAEDGLGDGTQQLISVEDASSTDTIPGIQVVESDLTTQVDQKAEEILISLPFEYQSSRSTISKTHHLSGASHKSLDNDEPLSISCSPKSASRLSQVTYSSMQQSEYSSDYTRSSRTLSFYSRHLDAVTNETESQPRSRPESDRSSNRDHSHLLNGPTNGSKTALVQRLLREEVYFFLKDSNLNSITRRDVKEHLFEHFGDAVTLHNDYIHDCIEEFTLEKLALLPTNSTPQSP